MKESKSLATFATIDELNTVEFAAINGWDDTNFWVASSRGRVFRQRDGIWQSLGRPESAGNPAIRCTDRDTLVVAGRDFPPDHLSRIDAKGISDLGDLGPCQFTDHTEICPISDDLLYCFRGSDINKIGTVRMSSGERSERPENNFKEAFVHGSDNTPLKEHPVRYLVCSRSFRAGTALALSPELRTGTLQNRFKLVRFRDGIWYDAGDLQHSESVADRRIHCAWLSGEIDAPTVILAGAEGWIQVQRVGASRHEQPVAVPPFATSLAMISVWGVSAEKYWAMDTSGTVWERAGSESRVVVRGLKQDNVAFRGAWVSPTGTVFAITDEHLYRLK